MTPAFAAKLPSGRSRALALGLLVIVIAAIAALLLVPALLLHRHYDEAIEAANDRLARYKRVASQAPDLGRALDAVRAKNGRRFYLKNTAANLAGAELQELVRGAVESNGGRIATSQNTGVREDGRFRQVGVNVQFFASTSALQKTLHSIETQVPYLVVDNLTVRPLNAFRGFKPVPGQEPEVNVALDVSAFMLGDAPKK